MINETDLKKYVCSVPFNSLEIHRNTYFLCCPSWLDKKIDGNDYGLEDVWNSEPVKDIRNSILEGSYKYCDKKLCPHLSNVIKFNKPFGPIGYKNQIKITQNNESPENVIFNFDRTCNYKCPSCRVDLIVESSEGIKRIEKTIEEIDTHYSKNVKNLYVTGTGDPFVSVSFRNYLKNFNPSKYPNLEAIHLHTNASMWTKDMWDSMPNIHQYVKSCEISIDAGTKDTYENHTRIGGNWDVLMNNLYFISTIKTLKSIKTSFVVQRSNYKEMCIFYDKMYSIFGNNVQIFFGKITNWGTFSEEEFENVMVWNESHPEHEEFKKELNKIWRKERVFHNLYEFIDYKKTLI
jgi:MoaA/NifB/PqqE/SkfB family radical SAM enzyme